MFLSKILYIFILIILVVATLEPTIDRIRIAVDMYKINKLFRTVSQLEVRVKLKGIRWRVAKKLLKEILNEVIEKNQSEYIDIDKCIYHIYMTKCIIYVWSIIHIHMCTLVIYTNVHSCHIIALLYHIRLGHIYVYA